PVGKKPGINLDKPADSGISLEREARSDKSSIRSAAETKSTGLDKWAAIMGLCGLLLIAFVLWVVFPRDGDRADAPNPSTDNRQSIGPTVRPRHDNAPDIDVIRLTRESSDLIKENKSLLDRAGAIYQSKRLLSEDAFSLRSTLKDRPNKVREKRKE